MPTIKCKCGGDTNTAVSEWVNPFLADKCYVKWVEGECVEGCAYHNKDTDRVKMYLANLLLNHDKAGE